MDKKLVGPLVLVILIVGSMIVPWVTHALGQSGNKKGPSETPAPLETPADNSKVDFFAEGVDANIQELSQVYPLRGYTDKTNLAVMVESIQSLESVSRISNPKFGNPEKGKKRFMPFSAEIVPARDSNIEEVKRDLNEKSILTDIVVFRKAMVKLPVHIKVKSLKQDLNISRDINLEEPFASCIVLTDSKTGDHLKVTLYLQMAGQQLIKETLQGSMEKNLSAQPKYHEAELETSISRLENSLGFGGWIPYTGFDENKVRHELSDLNGVESADFKAVVRGNSFGVNVAISGNKDVNKLKEDLNTALLGVSGVKKVFFDSDKNKLSAHASFEQGKYSEIRPAVLKALGSAFKDYNFELVDPTASVNGNAKFSDANASTEIALKASAVLSGYGIKVRILQDAFFDANVLPSSDGNFAVPAGQQEMPLKVPPGTKAGDRVKVKVYFTTIRGKITPGEQARTDFISYAGKRE